MTDPLSVTASVAAVITIGVSIAKGLYQIADTMGSAGREVRVYASDIQLMSSVLEGISDQLHKKARQSWSKAERVIEDILAVCNEILEPMNEIQATLLPLLQRYKDSNKKLRQVGARVWWFFKYKEKMLAYRQSLQNLNITLNTQLAAMKLNAATSTTINISVQQSSLELCVGEAKRLLQDRTQPQLTYQDSPQGRAITAGSASTIRSSSRASSAIQDRAESMPGPDTTDLYEDAETVQQNASVPHGDDISQALVLYSAQEHGFDDGADGLDVDEVVEVESTILGTLERTSASSTQEIWEDLGTVLRKVVRHAEEMYRASKEPVPQTNGQSSAADVRTPPVRGGDGNPAPRSAPPARGTNGASNKPDSQKPPAEESIRVKNVDGRTYLFPYRTVQRWDDVEKHLLSMRFPVLEMPIRKRVDISGKSATAPSPFSMVIVNPRYVFDNKLYFLKGPTNSIILPEFWSQTIQPGLDVELEFEDFIRWPGKMGDSGPVRKVVIEPSGQKPEVVVDEGMQQAGRMSKFWKR